MSRWRFFKHFAKLPKSDEFSKLLVLYPTSTGKGWFPQLVRLILRNYTPNSVSFLPPKQSFAKSPWDPKRVEYLLGLGRSTPQFPPAYLGTTNKNNHATWRNCDFGGVCWDWLKGTWIPWRHYSNRSPNYYNFCWKIGLLLDVGLLVESRSWYKPGW